MSENEYQKQMARLRRKLQMMEMARTGNVAIQRVKVRQYTVSEHTVRAHTRLYYRLTKES
jgi:hypothetical protein